jgi:hypothetical protein
VCSFLNFEAPCFKQRVAGVVAQFEKYSFKFGRNPSFVIEIGFSWIHFVIEIPSSWQFGARVSVGVVEVWFLP